MAVTAAACAGGDSPDSPDGDAAPTANEVTMRLIAFRPETLTVDAGAHTVTSGTVEQGGAGVTAMPDDKFDSGEIATGDTFELTFDEPGTYPYFCEIHPATMRGEVRVR